MRAALIIALAFPRAFPGPGGFAGGAIVSGIKSILKSAVVE